MGESPGRELDAAGAARTVCSLPHAPRACPGRDLSCASRAGPTCVGGGLGRGVVVVARGVSANRYPHPRPLPTRGRGAHHRRCSMVGQRRTTMLMMILKRMMMAVPSLI